MSKKFLNYPIKSWVIFISVFMFYGGIVGSLTDYTPFQIGLSAIPLALIYHFIENRFFNKSEKN